MFLCACKIVRTLQLRLSISKSQADVHKPLLQERSSGPGLRKVTAGGDRAHPHQSLLSRPDLGHGPFGRHRRIKNGPQTIDKLRDIWNTKIHMVTADVRTAISFSLLVSNDHDAVQGELQLEDLVLST